MNKSTLSLIVILAFALYVALVKNPQYVYVLPSASPTSSEPQRARTPAPVADNPAPTKPPPTPAPTVRQGQYRNGTYTGSVADAYYGYVQVQAVVQSGRIVDVQFLQYPSERQTSIEINSQAMPYLTQEAIQAQSANVDIVSGATQTSLAFRQSLADALGKAKN